MTLAKFLTMVNRLFLNRTAAIFLLLFGLSSSSEALNFCNILVARDLFVRNFTEDQTGKLLIVNSSSSVEIGTLINRGLTGSVYPVIAIDGLPPESPMVAKVPHRLSKFGLSTSMPMVITEVRKEIKIFEQIYNLKDQIKEKLTSDGQTVPWSGIGPGAPILRVLETVDYGPVLIKPLIKGVSFKTLSKRWQKGLPPEAIKSLNEILQFGKAVYAASGDQITLDLNTSNLAWVEDPIQVTKLGLKEPSFILYEYGMYPTAHFVGTTMDSTKFISEFVAALAMETQPEAPIP